MEQVWTSPGEAEAQGAGLELETHGFSPSCPPPTSLPSSHTPTFQDFWGRGSVHSQSGTPPPLPLGRAWPLLLKDRAAPPPPTPLSRTTEEGTFPLWDPLVPPHSCSFSHCDFALVPTHGRVGEGLPRKHGLGQVLTFLTLRDSCRKEGNGVFSPIALFIPPPPVSWPLSSGLRRPLPTPLPVGRCLRPPTGTPPRPRAKWTGTVRSHRAFCVSRTPHVEEGVHLCLTG